MPTEQAKERQPSLQSWWLDGDDEEEKESGVQEASLTAGVQAASTEARNENGDAAHPPVANPDRRRTYGPPRVSQEHKRERNRITFMRFYHRKQQLMRELRQEEAALTQQYQQLTLNHPARSSPVLASQEQRDASYMELVTHKDHLLAQNAALSFATQRNMTTRRILRRLVDELGGEGDGEAALSERVKITVMKRTGPDGHTRSIHHAIEELFSIERSSFEKNDEAFGWMCRWQERDDALDFTFKKQFTVSKFSAVDIAHRTWEFCTASDDHRTRAIPVPSSMLRTHRLVVETQQSMRECVMYRVITPIHRDQEQSSNQTLELGKSVYVVSLLRMPAPSNQFVVVSRSVDDQEHWCVGDDIDVLLANEKEVANDAGQIGGEPTEIREQWLDEMSWWRIDDSQQSPPSVEVSFTGRLPPCLLSSGAWFMELLRLVLQWEQAVFGTVVIACPDQ